MIGGYHPWFHEELQRRVAARRQERTETLASGLCADHATYQREVGFLQGMQEALEIADEIKKDIEKG